MCSMAACWHSASSIWSCTNGLSEAEGSVSSFFNLHLSPGCFYTGGSWVKYIRWYSLRQRKEPTGKRKEQHRQGQTPRNRRGGAPGGGLVAWPWWAEPITGLYIHGSEPDVAHESRIYPMTAPGQKLELHLEWEAGNELVFAHFFITHNPLTFIYY